MFSFAIFITFIVEDLHRGLRKIFFAMCANKNHYDILLTGEE